MDDHKRRYPEQYTHELVGQTVTVSYPSGSTVTGRVNRVVRSRFGLLAIIDGDEPGKAHAISKLHIIAPLKCIECNSDCDYRCTSCESPICDGCLVTDGVEGWCPQCWKEDEQYMDQMRPDEPFHREDD